jgi:hypothetical protein
MIISESPQISPATTPRESEKDKDVVLEERNILGNRSIVIQSGDLNEEVSCMDRASSIAFSASLWFDTEIPKYVRDDIKKVRTFSQKEAVLQDFRLTRGSYLEVSLRKRLAAGRSATSLFNKIMNTIGEGWNNMTLDEKEDILSACKVVSNKRWLNPGEANGAMLLSTPHELEVKGKCVNKDTLSLLQSKKINQIFFAEIGKKLNVGSRTSLENMAKLNLLDVQAICSNLNKLYDLSFNQLNAIPQANIKGTETTNLINFCKQIKDPSRKEAPELPPESVYLEWMNEKILIENKKRARAALLRKMMCLAAT